MKYLLLLPIIGLVIFPFVKAKDFFSVHDHLFYITMAVQVISLYLLITLNLYK